MTRILDPTLRVVSAASATALAPSDASPMTRMCGARESESRSPSRTTSWSSTIRQVISLAVTQSADRILRC